MAVQGPKDWPLNILINDLFMIVKDEALEEYSEKHKDSIGFDIGVFTLDKFKDHAKMGSPLEWDRYNYAYNKVLIDKIGKVQKLVDEKGVIPPEHVDNYINEHLDGYINYVYRSFKCDRDGNKVGSRMEASKTVHLFLNIAFALHDGRINPYYKYLEWELETYPLDKFPMDSFEILDMLLRILKDGDIETQRKLFVISEEVFRKEGYAEQIDSWEKYVIKWIKEYKVSIPKDDGGNRIPALG